MLNVEDIINKEQERAARRERASKSFIARNFWLWVVIAFIVYPLSSIFSALTEGGHIFLRAKAALGDGTAPWVITVILVLIIELLKFFLGKGAVDDLQANPFSQGGSTLAAFFVKALGFMAIMAFSVTLSVQGAEVINNYMRKNHQPVTTDVSYVDENAIIARYEQELLPHRQNIQQYQTIRWKGTITVDARRMIRKEQDQVDKILAARDAELSRVRANNDQLKGEWEAETEANGSYAMGFAGVGEVICLLAIIFIGVYDDGIRKELLSKQSRPEADAHHHYDDMPHKNLYSAAAASSPTKRTIGFHIYDDPVSPDIRMDHPDDPLARTSSKFEQEKSTKQDIPVEYLIGALKDLKKNADASRSNLRNKKGTDKSNLERIKLYEDKMDELKQILREKGIEV